jgi:hypothetical protein
MVADNDQICIGLAGKVDNCLVGFFPHTHRPAYPQAVVVEMRYTVLNHYIHPGQFSFQQPIGGVDRRVLTVEAVGELPPASAQLKEQKERNQQQGHHHDKSEIIKIDTHCCLPCDLLNSRFIVTRWAA